MHNHITNHLLYFRNGQRCVLDKLLWHGYVAKPQNFTLVTTRQNTDWLFPSTGNHGPYHHHYYYYYYYYHYYHYHCHYNYHQAEYRLTISTHWEPSAFPRHFPQWRPAPQWSKTIGDIFCCSKYKYKYKDKDKVKNDRWYFFGSKYTAVELQ